MIRKNCLADQPHSIITIRTFSPAPHQKFTESAAFRAALLFAQEYGILAASAEDRPFVPSAKVVICARNAVNTSNGGAEGEGEGFGVPEGMQRAFRKWSAGWVKECRVVGLAEALEAVGESR